MSIKGVNFNNMTMEPGAQKLIAINGMLYGIAYPGRKPMMLKNHVQIAYQDYLLNGGRMRYQEHPTWRMLEQTKVLFQEMLKELPRFHPVHIAIEEAHQAIVKIQNALENKLCQDSSQS